MLTHQHYIDSRLQEIGNKTLTAITGQHQYLNGQYKDDRDRKCHQHFRTSEYERHKNRNPNRVKGTCQWVLNHPQYKSWSTSTCDNLLWISADPGCGKSVLSKSLIDNELKSHSSCSTCYFFFKDNKEQSSLSTALCALLHQLFSYRPHLLHHAIAQWDLNGERLQKQTGQLWPIFLSAATDPAAGNVVCIFDALDECSYEGQKDLIDFLVGFYNSATTASSRSSTLKFLVTSRPYHDIELPFHRIVGGLPTIRLAGEEENEKIRDEIDLVTNAWVTQLSSDLKLQPTLQELLRTRLQQIKNRTYLWLYLVFEEIRKSLKRTERKFNSILDNIPESLDEAYENILNKSTDKAESRTLLSIIVTATRPLTLYEMDVAFALTGQDNITSYRQLDLDGDRLKTRIRNLCGLFVYVADSRVQLLHQTAKEFLVKKDVGPSGVANLWSRSLPEQDCEAIMAKVCARYLLFIEFEEPLPRKKRKRKWVDYRNNEWSDDDDCNDDDEDDDDDETTDEDNRDSCPAYDFMDYSAEHWPEHFRKADMRYSDATFKSSLILYDLKSPRHHTWFPVYRKSHYHVLATWTGLHFSAYCGHREVVRYLLENEKFKVDERDYVGRTALLLAAQRGHDKVVQLLVKEGADVHATRCDGFTALYVAAAEGHEAIVRFLVDKGADVNANAGVCGTALEAAFTERHEAIACFLVDKGADININANGLGSALSNAARWGCKALVQLLIDNGADDYNGALRSAASNGKMEIAQLMIQKGADDYFNPLWTAAYEGKIEVVLFLIENGADDYDSALRSAACGGKMEMVLFLIEKGADDYNGALEAAAEAYGRYKRISAWEEEREPDGVLVEGGHLYDLKSVITLLEEKIMNLNLERGKQTSTPDNDSSFAKEESVPTCPDSSSPRSQGVV
jgi:ankyrin repeat protein